MSQESIEDIYELTPMQQGMLFHSLFAPRSGVYTVQYLCTLGGALDRAAFEEAWQVLVDRHAVLRTTFQWQGLEKPVQIVHRNGTIGLDHHDLRDLPTAERQERLEAHCQDERERGFDLSQAPLMRVTLFEWEEGSHRLVWTFHHILLDGWSLGLVLGELFTIYEARVAGRGVRLPERRPYGDYIGWLQHQDAGKAEAYWRRALAGYTAPLPLTVDRAAERLPEEETGYRIDRTHLSPEQTTALNGFARQHRLTLNTLMQSAWALLLNRYTGESDVVFGTVVSGRPDVAGADEVIGLFVNTLPVRVEVSSHQVVQSWLRELQARSARGRRYEYSPLVEVHGWSEVPANLPLFETIVCFENFPMDESVENPGLSLELGDVRSVERVNYPLGLLSAPGERMALEIHHDPQRFEDAWVRRMLGHFEVLLASMVADPGKRLGDLELLTAAERHQILIVWGGHATEFPRTACLHQLFERQAREQPDAIAADFGERWLSYATLDHRASLLAQELVRRGCQPEEPVALFMESCLAAVVSILGILKAGGVYVPIDPAYPSERIAFILEDVRAEWILTLDPLANMLPAGVGQVIRLDRDGAEVGRWDTAPGHDPGKAVAAENLAYVIYTSGSTGKPKGVALTHRGLCNFATVQRRIFGVGRQSRVLHFSSLSFDASLFEILIALASGAGVVLGSRNSLLPSPGMVRFLERRRVTTTVLPPSVLAALPQARLPALTTLIVAGEACPQEVAEGWSAGRNFFNAYGPSEGTICATIGPYAPGQERLDIGRPIDNVWVYVSSSDLQPLPLGAPGELLIGGAGLARGYLRQPGLDARKFIPDPYGPEPGGRLYRTGDLARFLPGGRLEFLGRIDHQVKIRGFRIEPGEVEAALCEHPAVEQARVLPLPDASGGHRLAAYVVAVAGGELEVSALRHHLMERLPDYMVPTSFSRMDALPLKTSGKVDVEALLAAPGKALTTEEAFIAPRNAMEREIAAIWQQVLEVERVGIHDNIFDLGSHSLSLVKAQGLMVEKLGREIPLTALFNYPTVQSLVEYLADPQSGASALEESQQRVEIRKTRGRGRSARQRRRAAIAAAREVNET